MAVTHNLYASFNIGLLSFTGSGELRGPFGSITWGDRAGNSGRDRDDWVKK
jgi:hypothetical protein